MKRKLILAIILSMLTVVSVGCNFDISLDRDNDKSSSDLSKSDKNYKDEEKSKDNKKQSDFSAMFGSGNKSSSDIEDNDINISTEEQTEEVTEKTTEKSTEKTTEKATTKSDNNNFNIEHKNVLYDDNGLQILYIDSSEDYGYLDFNMYFQNNNDIELEVQAWKVYVNGTEIDAIMSAPIESKGVYSDCMSFALEDLKDVGISPDEIKTVEVSFHIFNWNDDSIKIDTELIKFAP